MRGHIEKLLNTLPQQGTLEMILLRPERKAPMLATHEAEIVPGQGITGDHFSGRIDSKRQVTLFQAEFLPVLASLLHTSEIDPALLRRNLIVRGIALNALSGKRFRVGEVILEGAAMCHPCSRMEKALGIGGFNAMRGIGGLCAKVVAGGQIRVGDTVAMTPDLADAISQEQISLFQPNPANKN